MNRILTTVQSAIEGVKSELVSADGILGTASALNNELQVFIRNAGVTVILVAFLLICWRKGWAAAGFIGGLFIAGLGYFAVNGGFELIGNLFRQTLGG